MPIKSKQNDQATPSKPSKKKRRVKKKSNSGKLQLFLVLILMLSIAFLSSAVILFIGLMPMFVAFFVDRSENKTKAVTVGAMNLAGCMPFLMELWTTEPTMAKAFSIVLDPMAIIVMYSAAGVGYIIDWALTLIIANLLYQRGVSRKKAIEKRQEELIERWGEEVSGRLVLDQDGFPLEEVVKADS